MKTQNIIDSLQEALRIIYLEGSKDATISSDKQMLFLQFSDRQMSDTKKELLLKKLKDVMCSPSFGQLLHQSIQQMDLSDLLIAEKVKLPVTVIKELKEDAIYTNNVPIFFLKNLLVLLNLSFSSVEQAIRKTFDGLQSQGSMRIETYSAFSPAFRKGHYSSRESITENRMKADGKELFENKEALDKYLARLDNLMKQ